VGLFRPGLFQRFQLSPVWGLSIEYLAPPLQHAGHIQAFAHELDLSDLLGAAAGGQLPLQHAADLHPTHIGEQRAVCRSGSRLCCPLASQANYTHRHRVFGAAVAEEDCAHRAADQALAEQGR